MHIKKKWLVWHNLYCNNYPRRITLAPRNLDRGIEDETRKLTTVCLLYVKGLAERIQRICSPYDIRTIFTSGSILQRYLFHVEPPTEFSLIKNCAYSTPCSCGNVYKGETGLPTKNKVWRTSETNSMRRSWIWRTIYGKKREAICPYWIKFK